MARETQGIRAPVLPGRYRLRQDGVVPPRMRRAVTEQPRPYNPLDLDAIAESIETKLLKQEPQPLPPSERFVGAGIYAIYYMGDFAPYAAVSGSDCEWPIYVGRALPRGGRKGRGGVAQPTAAVLFDRLRQHSTSIEAATNLSLDDFRCRFLVVEPFFVTLGERITIAHYHPVWNQAVDGFGNHDPGAGRRSGRRSDWDVLHPGRAWANLLAPGRPEHEILAKIEAHFVAPEPTPEPFEPPEV